MSDNAIQQLIERPVPSDLVQQIKVYARDLAEGVTKGLWSETFQTQGNSGLYPAHNSMNDFRLYTRLKWNDAPPRPYLLVAFDHLAIAESRRKDSSTSPGTIVTYYLTSKAFQLLEQATGEHVFISYRHAESSAFALHLYTQLKAVGMDVFIDWDGLPVGQDWRLRLEKEIQSRDHFICLVGPSTLEPASTVCQEIKWALLYNRFVVPVWHNNFASEAEKQKTAYPEFKGFLDINAIVIERENAEQYHNAVNRLLQKHFGITR